MKFYELVVQANKILAFKKIMKNALTQWLSLTFYYVFRNKDMNGFLRWKGHENHKLKCMGMKGIKVTNKTEHSAEKFYNVSES
jgi:hypothetical protein